MSANNKGFSLVELLIVLIILGFIVAIAMPKFMASLEVEKAQTAQNNLMAIAAAQSKYYEDNSNSGYVINSGGGSNCGATSAALFGCLSMAMTPNDKFTYSCQTSGSAYSCTATDASVSPNVTLTLNPAATHPVICTPSNLCPSNLPSS